MTTFNKSSIAILDYGEDWTAWLALGETIIGNPIITVPSGLNLAIPAAVNGGLVTFWLSGGTKGLQYNVSCQITTNQGRTDVRSFVLIVV